MSDIKLIKKIQETTKPTKITNPAKISESKLKRAAELKIGDTLIYQDESIGKITGIDFVVTIDTGEQIEMSLTDKVEVK